MKAQVTTMVAALVLLLFVAAGMAHHTVIVNIEDRHQAELATVQAEADRLRAEAYWEELAAYRPYSLPLDFLVVSSGVGYRLDPMGGGDEALHKGVDFVALVGTPVRAAMAGRVVEHWLVPGWHYGRLYHGDTALGGKIVLNHGNGMLSIYGHLSETYVHEDDWVEMGQVIGAVGNTGKSTGPHLHFELVVDPLRYLEGR